VPLYHYKCRNCESDFEIRHSWNDKNIICLSCKSLDIYKLMNHITPVVYKNKKVVDNKEVGDEVKAAIRDGNNDLRQMKRNLKKEANNTK